ncbi:2464_t:CDS:1, partial [Acaulospora colombiana]
ESLDRMRKLDSFVRETQRLSGIQNGTPDSAAFFHSYPGFHCIYADSHLNSASMIRLALQDFTFSNGVRVPKGETVAAVGNALHQDPDVYADALEFRPFRFYELGEAERAVHTSHKYDMITPSHDYLAWGLGKHAWYVQIHTVYKYNSDRIDRRNRHPTFTHTTAPTRRFSPGRWYASMIVKHLLAYVLIFYEFKFTDATAAAAMKANANLPTGKAGTTKTRPKDLELGGGCLPNTKAEMLFRKRKDEDVAFLSSD